MSDKSKLGFNINPNNYDELNSTDNLITSGSDSGWLGKKLQGSNGSNSPDISKINPLFDKELYERYRPGVNTNDGSVNQDIWGYKCFNSPVSFRNGIYGECGKLIVNKETESTSTYSGVLTESAFASTITSKDTKICVGNLIGHSDDFILDTAVHYDANVNESKMISSSSTLVPSSDSDNLYNMKNELLLGSGFSDMSFPESPDVGSIQIPYNSISVTSNNKFTDNSNIDGYYTSGIELDTSLLSKSSMSTTVYDFDISNDIKRTATSSIRNSCNFLKSTSGLFVDYDYNGTKHDAYAQLEIDVNTDYTEFRKKFVVSANILPSDGNNFDIGELSSTYNNIYANNIYGVISHLGRSSSYNVDNGTVNYSAIHAYSSNKNQEPIVINAGDKVTIDKTNTLFINGSKKEDVMIYLYNTLIENDPVTGSTVRKEGNAYGTIYGVSEISFTPLCDIRLLFYDLDSQGNKVTPPIVDKDVVNRLEINQVLAQEADNIARNETLAKALELGAANSIREYFDQMLVNKVEDQIDNILNGISADLPNINYADPVSDPVLVGIKYNKLTMKYTLDEINASKVIYSTVRNKDTKAKIYNGDQLSEDEKNTVITDARSKLRSELISNMNTSLRDVGISKTII